MDRKELFDSIVKCYREPEARDLFKIYNRFDICSHDYFIYKGYGNFLINNDPTYYNPIYSGVERHDHLISLKPELYYYNELINKLKKERKIKYAYNRNNMQY